MGQSSLVDQIVELAKEVETEDPIDWGLLSVSEDDAYRLIAMSACEMFENADKLTLIATITKLIVENFKLNLQREIINNQVNT